MPDEENTCKFTLFSGSVENKLDSQHRVAVPADWRNENPGGVFVLMPGRDKTLQLYTPSVYQEKFKSKLQSISPVNASEQNKLRFLYSSTHKLQCDKQGRIQIPQKLCDYAHLKMNETVAFIGSGDFGQLMDGERWKAEEAAMLSMGDGFLDILE